MKRAFLHIHFDAMKLEFAHKLGLVWRLKRREGKRAVAAQTV